MDLAAFLTSTAAPWWSGLLGVIAGGLLAFFSSLALEKRRGRESTRAYERQIAEADRTYALTTIAEFDGAMKALRVFAGRHRAEWAATYPEYVLGPEDDQADWPPEVQIAYANLRAREAEAIAAANIAQSRVRMLPYPEIVKAADGVWEAYRGVMPAYGHGTMHDLEAFDLACSVLTTVARITLQRNGESADDESDEGMYASIVRRTLHQRQAAGTDPPIASVYYHEGTNVTVFRLKKNEYLHVDSASWQAASEFLDQGMSAAVFVIEFETGEVDVFAIGLPTDGEPKTNAVPEEWTDQTIIGTITHLAIDEDGEPTRVHTSFATPSGNVAAPEGVRSGVWTAKEFAEEHGLDLDEIAARVEAEESRAPSTVGQRLLSRLRRQR